MLVVPARHWTLAIAHGLMHMLPAWVLAIMCCCVCHDVDVDMLWDEQLMSGVLELNRLRRSLAITSLTWAATLQEPSFFAQATVQAASGTPSAALVTGRSSDRGASMFHMTPALAAQRMGISVQSDGGDGQGAGKGGCDLLQVTARHAILEVPAVMDVLYARHLLVLLEFFATMLCLLNVQSQRKRIMAVVLSLATCAMVLVSILCCCLCKLCSSTDQRLA